jgi:hypothetical protein
MRERSKESPTGIIERRRIGDLSFYDHTGLFRDIREHFLNQKTTGWWSCFYDRVFVIRPTITNGYKKLNSQKVQVI